jgi:hypothetical protein
MLDAVDVPTSTVKVIAGAGVPDAIAFAAGRTHVTVWPEAVQSVQPVPVPETKVKPDGSTSVTVTSAVVAPEPEFETVTVYASFVPRVKSPVWALSIVKLGTPFTALVTLLLLLPGLTSPPPLTDAVLVTLPIAEAVGVKVIAIFGKLAPAASAVGGAALRLQLTGLEELHVQPVPAALTNVRPVGSTSFTVTVALVGSWPTFLTARV